MGVFTHFLSAYPFCLPFPFHQREKFTHLVAPGSRTVPTLLTEGAPLMLTERMNDFPELGIRFLGFKINSLS